MESVMITIVAILVILSGILTAIGQRNGWGVAPLGFLCLGFIIPFAMLLVGAL